MHLDESFVPGDAQPVRREDGAMTELSSAVAVDWIAAEEVAMWFLLTLDRALVGRQRRVWYRRLRQQLAAHGLTAAIHRDVLVVLGALSTLDWNDRHRWTNWLMNEPEVWAVQLGELIRPRAEDRLRWPAAPAAQCWLATGLPQAGADDFRRAILCSLARCTSVAQRRRLAQGASGRPVATRKA